MNDDLQRIADLERVQRNFIQHGHIKAGFSKGENNLVTVAINTGQEESIDSVELPMLGRTSAIKDEPVIILLPAANPAEGYVIGVLPDPVIKQLEDRITQLEQS